MKRPEMPSRARSADLSSAMDGRRRSPVSSDESPSFEWSSMGFRSIECAPLTVAGGAR
ncbi:MAG: hypothetical protein JWM27_506 [Gemmatimonadetes bacterium]|nr:hypothetical protein [Gemmatimonadota bacterium]